MSSICNCFRHLCPKSYGMPVNLPPPVSVHALPQEERFPTGVEILSHLQTAFENNQNISFTFQNKSNRIIINIKYCNNLVYMYGDEVPKKNLFSLDKLESMVRRILESSNLQRQFNSPNNRILNYVTISKS